MNKLNKILIPCLCMFSCLFNTNIRAIDEKTKNWVINNPKKSVMITLGGLGGISLSSVLMCNLIKSISNNFCKFNTDSYKIGQDGKVMANVLINIKWYIEFYWAFHLLTTLKIIMIMLEIK